MPITITVPADTKTPGTAGHTSDHNVIADALATLGTKALSADGDVVTLVTATPATPAAGMSVLYASSAGTPVAKLDSGYSGAVALGSPADHSSHAATAATATAITAAWTIPANDAVAGTLYRLTFAGFGTWGSTQQALNVLVLVDGTNVMAGAGSGQVAATEFAINTTVWIRGVAEVLIVSTGAGGTMTVSLEYTVSVRGAAALTGTAATNSVSVVNLNSVTGGTNALDTTASHTLAAAAAWASTTGAPTVTGTQSFLERLGA